MDSSETKKSCHSCAQVRRCTIKDAFVCHTTPRVATAMVSELRVNAAANVVQLFVQTLVVLRTTPNLDSERLKRQKTCRSFSSHLSTTSKFGGRNSTRSKVKEYSPAPHLSFYRQSDSSPRDAIGIVPDELDNGIDWIEELFYIKLCILKVASSLKILLKTK
ncbi:hypothetical protein TNCV_4708581 [Trichonephila clavipes]|nr:hypothetical protein TNCV_4708581 [Trichonephila clavipes]